MERVYFVELVPLKIHTGWLVSYNNFYYSDALETHFNERLLIIVNEYFRRIIDLGWYPKSNPSGEYCIIVAVMSEGVHGLGYWNGPLAYFKSKDIHSIIEKLNEYMAQINAGNL